MNVSIRKFSVIMIGILLIFLMAGCGAAPSANTAKISEAAEGLLTALEEGEPAEIYGFCTDDMPVENVKGYQYVDELESTIQTALEAEDDYDSENYSNAQLQLKSTFDDQIITSYELGDITEENGTGKVRASVTYGFDLDKLEDIDVNAIIADSEAKYEADHQAELDFIRRSEGDTAVGNALMDGISEEVLALYSEQALATGEVTRDVLLTVENTEDGWKVSDFDAQ